MPMPITIFFCYAREDKPLLNKLKTHLRPLQQQGLIDVWHDGDILAGAEWEQEIKQHLNTAQIVLLLVSPEFMASEYCYSIQMKRAVERHERKEARVIPVILDHVYWQVDPLNKLQALPTDAKPIMGASWHSLNEALFNVTEGIRKVVEQLLAQRTTTPVTVEKRTVQHTLKGHTELVMSVAISPDGQTIVSASWDGTIKIWHPSTGKEARTLTGNIYYIMSVAISINGQTLASGSTDDTIKVWELSTGQELHTLTGHTDSVYSVAISPDRLTLVSGSADHTIKVWDLSSGQEIRTLTGHTGTVWSIAISPNGKTLVSASADKTIKVWDLSSGQEIRTLTGHTSSIKSVAISPDGQTLVSASADKTIKVWDLSSGQEIRTLSGHTGGVMSVATSPDGKTLVSGSLDGLKCARLSPSAK